jgi:serine phosphatase RsbU (regulator of sigma subunit)
VVAELELPASGTLLAFTDGLVERRGEVIDAGLTRLGTVAGAADGMRLEAFVDEVMRSLTADGGKDDTVLVGLRWTR